MPIIDTQRRLHEAGRIRIGQQVATERGKRPSKLDTFRLTSRNHQALDHLATIYGGTVKPWADAPIDKQFELITEADEIRVMVPPEAMGFSQWYELWKAGGCERRCDGLEMADGNPCVCDPEARDCKPHTRLSVMLQQYPTSGLWRLDTSGEYARAELAGAFELATMLIETGGRRILAATLRLEQRQRKTPGKGTRNFAVPVLDFDINPAALVGIAGPNPAPPGHVAHIPPGGMQALPAHVIPVPAIEAPSLQEQLAAVDQPSDKPARRNAAAPVKATGRRPRPVGPLTQDEPETGVSAPEIVTTPQIVDAPVAALTTVDETVPEVVAAAQGGAGAVPEAAARIDPAEFASFFAALEGQAASKRWSVLREFGWSTDFGNDVAKWAANQPGATLTAAFERLLDMRETVSA